MRLLLLTLFSLVCFGTVALADEGPAAAPDADTAKFMQRLQTEIKQRWNPPRLDHSVDPVVKFHLTKDGKVTDAAIKDSSGDKAFDAECVRAIAEMPRQELPAVLRKDGADVQFDFKYNAYKPNRARHHQHSHEPDVTTWVLIGIAVLVVGWKFWRYGKFFVSLAKDRLPPESAVTKPLSAKFDSAGTQLPNLDMAAAMRSDGIRLALMALIGLGALGWGLTHQAESTLLIFHVWPVADKDFYIWAGLIIMALAYPVTFGTTNYVRFGLDLPNRTQPKEAIVTVAKDPVHPLQARIQSYTDGTPVGTKEVKLFGYGWLPAELPFTDHAQVYADPVTGTPVMVRIGEACLFVRRSGVMRRLMFMPWKR